jgi:hypothetical protein
VRAIREGVIWVGSGGGSRGGGGGLLGRKKCRLNWSRWKTRWSTGTEGARERWGCGRRRWMSWSGQRKVRWVCVRGWIGGGWENERLFDCDSLYLIRGRNRHLVQNRGSGRVVWMMGPDGD